MFISDAARSFKKLIALSRVIDIKVEKVNSNPAEELTRVLLVLRFSNPIELIVELSSSQDFLQEIEQLADFITRGLSPVNDNPVNYYTWLNGNGLLSQADKSEQYYSIFGEYIMKHNNFLKNHDSQNLFCEISNNKDETESHLSESS